MDCLSASLCLCLWVACLHLCVYIYGLPVGVFVSVSMGCLSAPLCLCLWVACRRRFVYVYGLLVCAVVSLSVGVCVCMLCIVRICVGIDFVDCFRICGLKTCVQNDQETD